jgi:hypothetical protein
MQKNYFKSCINEHIHENEKLSRDSVTNFKLTLQPQLKGHINFKRHKLKH